MNGDATFVARLAHVATRSTLPPGVAERLSTLAIMGGFLATTLHLWLRGAMGT